MKAIKTRYLAQTAHRPARIKASTHNGPSITVSYYHDNENDDPHMRAAVELCAKHGWPMHIVGGHLSETEMVWCFVV